MADLPNQNTSISLGPLPVSVMQALYHEITGNTETLSKSFNEANLIKKTDIEQLCIKLHQICGQFDVVGENTSISIRHINSMVQKLSSLSKFNQYDENIPYAIDTITIEHSALIQVPATKKHYQYKISVVLESTDLSDRSDFSKVFIFPIFGFDHIKVRIEYVDYVVARTFLAAAEEWTAGLEKLQVNKFLIGVQGLIPPRNSTNWLHISTAIITFAATLLTAFKLRDTIIVQNDLFSLVNFAIIVSAAYFITNVLLKIAREIFESRLLSYSRPGLILINRGDQENYQAFVSSKRSAIKASLLYIVEIAIVVILNILSNRLYDIIK